MRNRFENKGSMIKTILSLLSENRTIVQTVPELDSAYRDLDRLYTQIKTTDSKQKNAVKGRVTTKQQSRSQAMKSALSVTGSLYGYGSKVKNNIIMEKSDITRSEFERMRDTEFIESLETIRDLAASNIGELQPFGLTQEKLDSFSEKITGYDNAFGDKETGVLTQTDATKNLTALFQESSRLLKTIDKLVNSLLEEEKTFVEMYFKARRIKQMGIRYRIDEQPENNVQGENGPENSS